MNTTRIKYLDMDECPSNVLNEMLVVGGICMGIPFGVWWLGCLLFDWIGWEGKDPELVRQAMDEARAAKDDPGVSSSASFRLVDALAKKEKSLSDNAGK